ncbi:MAG: hypothetical protein Kow0010_03660 [Dehalococcoidia bacterium]
MTATGLPGDMDDLAFLEAYRDGTLRVPQVVADSILRAVPFASPSERPALVAGIAGQLAEACFGLALVFDALDSRRLPVARALLATAPGPGAWRNIVQIAATADPEGLVRRLAIDAAALHAVRALRARDLSATLAIVDVYADGAPLTFPGRGGRVRLVSASSPSVAVEIEATEEGAVALADLVGDVSSAARALLDGYIVARAAPGKDG